MVVQVRRGHAVTELQALARERPKSVAAICTSPPYFRCRKYGGEPQVWPNPDGTPLCADGAHEWDVPTPNGRTTGVATESGKQNSNRGSVQVERGEVAGHLCSRCGAWRGDLGWEPDLESFIDHLVQVFEAARGVLRNDGSLWVNIAGNYANESGGQNGATGGVSERAVTANRQAGRTDKTGGLPKLNYLDVPGLLGRAMQKAGWIWRSNMVLTKRSPLPESVTGWRFERCRVKVAVGRRSAEPYKVAIAGPLGQIPHSDALEHPEAAAQWADCPGCPKCRDQDGLVLRKGAWRPTRATEALLLFVQGETYWSDAEAVKVPAAQPIGLPKLTGQLKHAALQRLDRSTLGTNQGASTRNAWDWKEWPTSGGFAGAHFAAYPPDLPAWCIKASVPERCCPTCGAGYARIIERVGTNAADESAIRVLAQNGVPRTTANLYATTERGGTVTRGWKATCRCPEAPPVPGTVLDPFFGSGSTGIAAERLGRDCIGIDLNPEYTSLSVARVTGDAPLLTTVSVAAPSAPASRQLGLFPDPQGAEANG